MKQNHKILYGKGAYGIRQWEIWNVGNTIHIAANGQEYLEIIPEGKASRSLDEQIELRVRARVRNKLDQGFKFTKEEALETMTNQLNLPLPMLAKKHSDVKVDFRNCYVQPKLDGHRCLITRNIDGELIAYSRRGKVIETIGHILEGLSLPEGVVLDGELYHHGSSLQTIASWAKRQQPSSKKLQYHAYDLIDMTQKDMVFDDRYNYLLDINSNSNSLSIVNTAKIENEEHLNDMLLDTIDEGYEGLILRPQYGLYGIGKRSNELLKVKRRLDDEFKCVDIIPSREGWGILVLETKSGKRFKSLAPGTIDQKIKTLANKYDYIGRWVTAEFAGYTDEGIPFHAACNRWRIDV